MELQKAKKIVELVRDIENIENQLEKLDTVRHWTRVTINGEDGTEREFSFSVGGTSAKNSEYALAVLAFNAIKKEYKKRLDVAKNKLKSYN